MSKINIIDCKEVPVLFVESQGGVVGVRKAFSHLENKVKDATSKKFFGLFFPGDNKYYAACKNELDLSNNNGLDNYTIPSGKYVKTKVINWTEKIDEIKDFFKELENLCKKLGYEVDVNRPYIEFYKSMKDLVIMLPIKCFFG